MTGLEKIVDQIIEEANTEAEKILATAQMEADTITKNAKEEAAQITKKEKERLEAEKSNMEMRARSSADLKKRQVILKAKQDILSDILEKAYQKMLNMDTKSYFELLEKMLDKYVLGKDGEIYFSQKDLERMPEDFTKKVKSIGKKKGGSLNIASCARTIDGGFILNYGGIEENCSFKSIFLAEKETLADKVNEILFA